MAGPVTAEVAVSERKVGITPGAFGVKDFSRWLFLFSWIGGAAAPAAAECMAVGTNTGFTSYICDDGTIGSSQSYGNVTLHTWSDGLSGSSVNMGSHSLHTYNNGVTGYTALGQPSSRGRLEVHHFNNGMSDITSQSNNVRFHSAPTGALGTSFTERKGGITAQWGAGQGLPPITGESRLPARPEFPGYGRPIDPLAEPGSRYTLPIDSPEAKKLLGQGEEQVTEPTPAEVPLAELVTPESQYLLYAPALPKVPSVYSNARETLYSKSPSHTLLSRSQKAAPVPGRVELPEAEVPSEMEGWFDFDDLPIF